MLSEEEAGPIASARFSQQGCLSEPALLESFGLTAATVPEDPTALKVLSRALVSTEVTDRTGDLLFGRFGHTALYNGGVRRETGRAHMQPKWARLPKISDPRHRDRDTSRVEHLLDHHSK